MVDWSLRRWVGTTGLAFAVIQLVGFAIFFVAGVPPSLNDPAKLAAYLRNGAAIVTTSALLFYLGYGFFFMFLAGLRGLIRTAGEATEWLGTAIFGIGIALAVEAIISIGLIQVAAIDAAGKSDPTAVRVLYEASATLAGAPTTITALFFLAVAAYAIGRTGVLPRSVQLVGWIGVVVIAVTIPAAYGGNDPNGFYTANGLVQIIATVMYYVWLLVASVAALRTPRTR